MQFEPASDMDSLVFERLTPEMHERLQSFMEKLSPKTYRDATNIPRESFVDSVCQQLDWRTIAIVGRKAGDIISFGLITVSKSLRSDHNREARVDGLIVRTDFQGRGIGSLTLKQLLKIAKSRGCRKITLLALKHNNAVIEFYQKRGFKIAKERRLRSAYGNHVVKFYEMKKTSTTPQITG
jgi:ribosomal protein S18 acetylase RimI-like enzyme